MPDGQSRFTLKGAGFTLEILLLDRLLLRRRKAGRATAGHIKPYANLAVFCASRTRRLPGANTRNETTWHERTKPHLPMVPIRKARERTNETVATRRSWTRCSRADPSRWRN